MFYVRYIFCVLCMFCVGIFFFLFNVFCPIHIFCPMHVLCPIHILCPMHVLCPIHILGPMHVFCPIHMFCKPYGVFSIQQVIICFAFFNSISFGLISPPHVASLSSFCSYKSVKCWRLGVKSLELTTERRRAEIATLSIQFWASAGEIVYDRNWLNTASCMCGVERNLELVLVEKFITSTSVTILTERIVVICNRRLV
jgi:hypothetical protein